MVEDFKPRKKARKRPSKKKRQARLNAMLRVAIMLCLGLSMAMVLMCAVSYASNAGVFHARDITVEGLSNVAPEEILTILDLDEGDNVLSWNIDQARERLAEHPWVKEVSISRRFVPARVTVHLTEHTPRATLLMDDKRYLISEENRIFAPAPEENCGLVIKAKDYSPDDAGADLEQLIERTMQAAAVIQGQGLHIDHLQIEPGGRMCIALKNGITFVCLGPLTADKVHMALRTMDLLHPGEGTTMDLSCADKIIVRSSHGS